MHIFKSYIGQNDFTNIFFQLLNHFTIIFLLFVKGFSIWIVFAIPFLIELHNNIQIFFPFNLAICIAPFSFFYVFIMAVNNICSSVVHKCIHLDFIVFILLFISFLDLVLFYFLIVDLPLCQLILKSKLNQMKLHRKLQNHNAPIANGIVYDFRIVQLYPYSFICGLSFQPYHTLH